MGAPTRGGASGSPFCAPGFEADVRRWLQCRAAPEERARYERYMALLQEAAAGGRASSPLSSARSGSASCGGRAPRDWSALPAAAAPALLEASAMRARPAPAPGARGARSASPPQAPAWAHTATAAAAARRGGGGGSTRAASAGGSGAPAAAADLRLPPKSVAPAAAGSEAGAGAQGGGGGGGGGGDGGESPTARLSRRAAEAAAAPQAPKGGALDITTAQAAYGLKTLYPDLVGPGDAGPCAEVQARWVAPTFKEPDLAPLFPSKHALPPPPVGQHAAHLPPQPRAQQELCQRLVRAPGAQRARCAEHAGRAPARPRVARAPPHAWGVCCERPRAPPRARRGESLRKGAVETWAPFLHSSYALANAQVHKPVRAKCGPRSARQRERARHAARPLAHEE